MASVESRLKKLEKKAATAEGLIKKAKTDLAALKSAVKADQGDLKKRVAKLEKDVEDIITWIEGELAWSTEVTAMLRQVDWGALVAKFPGPGGMNPPQTPPDWPVS